MRDQHTSTGPSELATPRIVFNPRERWRAHSPHGPNSAIKPSVWSLHALLGAPTEAQGLKDLHRSEQAQPRGAGPDVSGLGAARSDSQGLGNERLATRTRGVEEIQRHGDRHQGQRWGAGARGDGLRFSATKASVPNPRGVLSRADLGSDFDEAPQKRMPCNDGGLGLPAETLTSTGWAS